MATSKSKAAETTAFDPAVTDTAGDIPAADKQPTAAPEEQAAVVNTAVGSDAPLSVDHPRLAKGDDKVSKAQEEFMKAQAEANAARMAADVSLTEDQKKANELAQKADDLRAKAVEEMTNDADSKRVIATVADAGTLAVVPPELKAADHFAQKFGNDPENPKLADGIKPDENLVLLYRITPDVPGRVYAEVPEKMAGDYQRAGWNRA
jgi:hypothetical protein